MITACVLSLSDEAGENHGLHITFASLSRLDDYLETLPMQFPAKESSALEAVL